MPFKVIDQMFNHPLTDKGQAQFLADWRKSGRNNSVTEAGTTITVRACKYDGREHRRWTAQILKQDGALLVLDAYFPEEISHDLLETIAAGTHSLSITGWTVGTTSCFAEPSGVLRNYYCNVNVPPSLDGETLSYIDLIWTSWWRRTFLIRFLTATTSKTTQSCTITRLRYGRTRSRRWMI